MKKSDIVRKIAEKAGIPVVEIKAEQEAPEILKGIPVPKGLNFEKDGAGIPDGQLSKELTSRPSAYFCPKCHQAWIVHDDDGSCIVD